MSDTSDLPEPQYPAPPEYPAYPTAPPDPPAYPATPPTPPQDRAPEPEAQPQPHPHEMAFGQRRIHLADRQRGADATAVSQLVLHVPSFLISLMIVAGISYAFLPTVGWLPVLLWLASGALVFHKPAESSFARHLLGLRYPTPQERARLEPIWTEVTARAGVDGRTYELWIEDSDELNAYAAAGHIVGVTGFSLHNLPNGQLAAVLAHELGHHTGGHAWSGLLGYWYALPGRLAWVAVRKLARFGVIVATHVNGLVALLLFLVLGSCLVAFTLSIWYILLPLTIAPYLLAAVGRRGELRADQHAAALGFAPMLAEVLHTMHAQEQGELHATAVAAGGRVEKPGALAGLLSSHPDYHTRLHHLQPYLQPGR